MAEYVWGVRMENDISANSAAAASSLEDLEEDVQSLANTFRVSQASTRALSVSLDQARGLFKSAGGNVSLFRAALKDAGVSALDSSILVGKMTKELQAERRSLLGVTAEEDAHRAAIKASSDERKAAIALAKQQAKEEKALVKQQAKEEKARAKQEAAAAKAREKAAEKARKEGERRDKMGLLERMGVTPHNIWVASHAMNVISKSIGAVGAVGGAIKNVVGGIAGKAMEVGQGLFESVVDAAQFRQNALTGLEYMLGSRQEAEDMFAYAQKYAQETPLDTDKVLGGMKALITQGFSGDEAKLLYKVVADQQSKYMDDQGMQDKVIAAFSRVQGRGKATGEDLESFRVAGFRAEGIVEQLLKNDNLSPLWKKIKRQGMDGGKATFVSQDKATQEEILKEVQAAMGEGRIGKYTLMNAAIASLEDGHENIGEFAKKSGKNSLTGAISNIKALWGDLLKSVNIQDWPGIQSLQRFLVRVVDLFAAGGPAATRLLGVVSNVFNAMTGGLDAIENKDILSWLDTLESFAKGVVSFIKEAWGWVDQLLHMEAGSVADSAIDAVILVGKYLGAALWEGFKAGDSLLEDRKNQKQVFSDAQYFSVASSTGLDENALKKTFPSDYRAFIAAGNKVPDAGFLGNQEMATYNAVTEWAKRADAEKTQNELMFNAIYPPIRERTQTEMTELGYTAANSVKTGWQTALEQHSPSKVLLGLGRTAAESLVDGLNGGMDNPREGQGGGGRLSIGEVNVNVTAVGTDPDALRQAIREPLIAEMTDVFERLSREA
mgnify:CR=1 FL=1